MSTYNFFIKMLQAAYDEVHILLGHGFGLSLNLLCISLLVDACLGKVARVMDVGGAFEIKIFIAIDNFEQGLVVWQIDVIPYLLLKGLFGVVWDQLEFITTSHEHH